jgi:FkbM family methyltransferase
MFALDIREISGQKQDLFCRLMAGVGPVYVLGRNKYAQRVAAVVAVQGFIDDFTEERVYLGRPVIRMADLPKDGLVVSCVVAGRSLTALDRLCLAGARDVLDYFTLSRLAAETFGSPDFCAGNRQDILKNTTQYEWVYHRLADEVSRQHFARVIRFRQSLDLEDMRGFTLALDHQYFEDFLLRREAEVFVDGGGYDGRTTRHFAAWNPAYRRIHYVEPIPAMMEVSRRNLAGLRGVRFLQKGLFSHADRLRFDAEEGDASRLCATGQSEIDVVRLDDEVREPITFVKLDIEGAEYDAIEGAAEHIRSETPTIAVCVYHNQRDFWRVPRRVLDLNDQYDLYVRHYTEGVHETVMFFVPQGNHGNGQSAC